MIDETGFADNTYRIMGGALASILAVWAFVANPALCVAGLWVHACAPACHCCEDDCDPCTQHGCEDDPCQPTVIRAEKEHDAALRPCDWTAIATDLPGPAMTGFSPGETTSQGYTSGTSPGSIALSARISPLIM